MPAGTFSVTVLMLIEKLNFVHMRGWQLLMIEIRLILSDLALKIRPHFDKGTVHFIILH